MKSEKSTIAEKVQSIKGKTVAKYGAFVFLFFGLTSCYNQKNDRLSSQVELYREKSMELAEKYDDLVSDYDKLN